ncbi:MAG TPA: hypothetical protein VFV44_02905 [Nitrospiraceae bacterium]|nr:hypothetical protein [Nitrospiraceae bacterium]
MTRLTRRVVVRVSRKGDQQREPSDVKPVDRGAVGLAPGEVRATQLNLR